MRTSFSFVGPRDRAIILRALHEVAMDAQQNKAVVQGFLAALARGDRGAARVAFREDATWRYPASLGGPGVHRGRDAIFDVYFGVDEKLFDTGTRRYDFEITSAVAEGDRVAVEMRHRGRTRDGRPYETDYHVLYRLEDGRIAEVHEYFDSLYVRRLYRDEELGVGRS
ncbi:MAG TPA: nuclear transport factor 2 family protein [Myxococcota bacterium]|nr:nuclear transport factor 2 family protein [Myxococcota bacterium]